MGNLAPLSGSPIDRGGLHFNTLAAQMAVSDSSTGDLTPPIHLATSFKRDATGKLTGDFIYSRSHNPNRAMLEHSLTELEGGVVGTAFASGYAARSGVIDR